MHLLQHRLLAERADEGFLSFQTAGALSSRNAYSSRCDVGALWSWRYL